MSLNVIATESIMLLLLFFPSSARERLDNDLLELESVVISGKKSTDTSEDENASEESKTMASIKCILLLKYLSIYFVLL